MTTPRPITGRTVLFGMLAFFGTIFAVNGAFVYFALDSWPGLRYDNAYERGIHYNKILDAAKTQSALGWHSIITVRNDDGGHLLEARVIGADGAPVTGLQIKAQLSRPTHEGMDSMLDLSAAATPGTYGATLKLPEPGRWQAEIVASRDGRTVYRMRHGITIRP